MLLGSARFENRLFRIPADEHVHSIYTNSTVLSGTQVAIARGHVHRQFRHRTVKVVLLLTGTRVDPSRYSPRAR